MRHVRIAALSETVIAFTKQPKKIVAAVMAVIELNRIRQNESLARMERKPRLRQNREGWWVYIREETPLGPFDTSEEAAVILAYYVERSQWQCPELLARYSAKHRPPREHSGTT